MRRNVYLLLFFVSTWVWAQNPITYAFDAKNGLSDNEVYDLEQDNDGFIWVAANNGLLRYNGRTFETIALPKQKGTSVFNLIKDKNGTLWCNNLYGQIFKATATNAQLEYDINDILKGDLGKFILRPNEIVVFSENGVFKVTKTSKHKLINKTILQSYETPKHYLLVDANQQLLFVNKTNFRIQKTITLTTEEEGKEELKKPIFFKLKNNYYLFYTINKKGYVKHINGTNLTPVQTPENFALTKLINLVVTEGKVWLSDEAIVYVCDIENNVLSVNKTLFEGEKISDVLIDDCNNYWFSSLQNGIKVSPNINLSKIDWDYSKYGYIVGSAAYKNNTILYYTDKAYLVFFNLITKKYTTHKIPTPRTISTITYNAENNAVYIGVNYNESFVFKISSQSFKKIYHFNVAKDIDFINNDVLYITYNKTVLYKNYNQKVLQGKIENEKQGVILDNSRGYVANFNPITNQTLLCNANGLWLYSADFKNKKIVDYNGEKLFTSSIAVTQNGTFWVAGKHHGLFYIKNSKLHHYPINFSERHIRFIKSYGNELWIVTDTGIELLNTETQQHEIYSSRFGVVTPISTLEVTKNSIFYTSNTDIYLVNRNIFKNQKNTKPSLYFTSVAFMDENAPLQNSYKLHHDSNNLKFSFGTNTFNSTNFVKYKYRLKGLENNWQTTTTAENTVKYFAVPPGKYQFEIKPFFNDTLQEGKTKTISVTIQQPFWRTWWFILLAVSSLLGSIYLILRYRNNIKIQRKNEEISKLLLEKRMAGLQLENLRSQMNPHFIFNALNSIQEYIVNNEKKLASAYLVKFSRLMRLYLEQSKTNEITLEEEIQTLNLYLTLEKNRFGEQFTYAIHVAPEVQTQTISVPSLLLQPYIENAVKHGLAHKKGDKNVSISFSSKNNFLEVVIDDNGIGRDAANTIKQRSRPEHQSFATKASNKRIEIVNTQQEQKIKVQYIDKKSGSTATGTQVIITIPIKTIQP